MARGDPAGETECLKLLELHTDFWIVVGWLSAYYVVQGRLDEARTYAERVFRLVPAHLGMAGCLAGILNRLGEVDRAAILRAKVSDDQKLGAPIFHFNYHMATGDFAAAAPWLEKCIEQHDTRAPWILPNLYGPGFTASPYWPPLARKMNLPV